MASVKEKRPIVIINGRAYRALSCSVDMGMPEPELLADIGRDYRLALSPTTTIELTYRVSGVAVQDRYFDRSSLRGPNSLTVAMTRRQSGRMVIRATNATFEERRYLPPWQAP